MKYSLLTLTPSLHFHSTQRQLYHGNNVTSRIPRILKQSHIPPEYFKMKTDCLFCLSAFLEEKVFGSRSITFDSQPSSSFALLRYSRHNIPFGRVMTGTLHRAGTVREFQPSPTHEKDLLSEALTQLEQLY
jgi:hypothetical protein